MVQTVSVTQYIASLREGGSRPAIVEADDGNTYALKFVGAAQGAKALIAELVAGEIARHLGLPVPEIALMDLDPVLGRSEPHPEIRDLILASRGLNLGLRFLSNALPFNSLADPAPPSTLASEIVWFDALVTNVDRTHQNVNLLMQNSKLWMIDHGAAMYFHHGWGNYLAQSQSPFAYIKDHTLLFFASELESADRNLREQLTPAVIEDIIAQIPAVWLGDEPQFATVAEHRQAYVDYFVHRLDASAIFVEEAINARAKFV